MTCRGKLIPGDLLFVLRGQENRTMLYEPVFQDKTNKSVFLGDTVEFKIDSIFPSSGIVSNIDGENLKIATFNTLLNKWEYYKVCT